MLGGLGVLGELGELGCVGVVCLCGFAGIRGVLKNICQQSGWGYRNFYGSYTDTNQKIYYFKG